ncbi:hypothetical protein SPL85_13595 [Enterobacter hormaechei subsp. xiangfangensis]
MDHKNFSVLFFYKPDRQTAPALAAVRKTRTEKIEKNFSVFHFHGSAKDRAKKVTNRKMREILILCQREGSFLFSGGVYSVRAEASPGAAQWQRERYWQTEKVAHYNTGYAYSVFGGAMRKVSINGAVFIFMARGEKLKDSDWMPSNGLPDSKYVLWPRGEGWDVRYSKFGSKGIEWWPIGETLFADEPEAWQAAYGHWMKFNNS